MTEAERFVSEFEAEVFPAYRSRNLAYWEHSLRSTEESARNLQEKTLVLRKLYEDRERMEQVRRLLQAGNQKDEISRCLTLLDYGFTANQGDPVLNKRIVELEVELNSVFGRHRPTINGDQMTDNEIERLLQRERNEETRRLAWQASKSIGEKVAPLLLDLVRLRNEKAHAVGYRNYYEMSMALQEINLSWLLKLWEELEKRTKKAYRDLIDELRRATGTFLGRPVSALQPWHLADPFFQRVPPWLVKETHAEVGAEVVELARQTYADLGMPVDEILERSDLYEKPGKSPHAYCIDIDRKGDIRILANCVPDERWVSTMMHELGHAVYDQYLDSGLPFTLRTPAHIATTEAVALLMGRIVRDSEWRARYLPERSTDTASAHQYHRVESLIFQRWVLVMTFFEKALYEEPDRNLEALWWDLVERYQGIQRPQPLPGFSWATKIHLAKSPVYYHNYLLGEIMSWQIERHLLRETNKMTLCGNSEAMMYLKRRLFRYGALRPWGENLEAVLGEKFSVDPYLKAVGA